MASRVFFERKFDLDPETANIVNSMVYMLSAFLAPLMGLVIDKLGKNVTFVFGSLLVTIVGHMLLAFTFISPWFSMVRNILMCIYFHLKPGLQINLILPF